MLKEEVQAKIDAIGENDFPMVRMSLLGDFFHYPHKLLEDVPSRNIREGFRSIDAFKVDLAKNVTYLAKILREYSEEGVPMVIFDGTSALSYRQIMTAAYRQYNRMHKGKPLHVPEMGWLDAHPLRVEGNLKGADHVITMVSQMNEGDIQRVWRGQADHVFQTLAKIRRYPEGSKIVVFDEGSNIFFPHKSLSLATSFLTSQVPRYHFYPETPLMDSSVHKSIIIPADHPARILKRPDDNNGGDPALLIRAPYRENHPGLTTHLAALRLSSECRRIGRLVARAM